MGNILIQVVTKKNNSSVTGPEFRWNKMISDLCVNKIHLLSNSVILKNNLSKIVHFEEKSFNWKNFLKEVFWLRKYINKNNITKVLTNGDIITDIIIGISMLFSEKKLLIFRAVEIQDLIQYSFFKRQILHFLDFIISLKADKIIYCTTNYLNCNTLKSVFFKKKLTVIYNGYNIDFKKNKSKSEVLRIGMAAHLTWFKGWDSFIKIASEFKHNYKIEFHIYGDGEMFQSLSKEIYNKQLNIVMHGFEKNTNNIFQNIDIYLHTSYREGLSVSMIQALHYSLPIICFDVGGNNEICGLNKTNLCVKKSDIHLIYEKIKYFLSIKNRGGSLISKENKIRAEKYFSYNSMLNNYKEILCK